MKVLKKSLYLMTAILIMASCTKDYDGPRLDPPVYEGKANITIKELKDMYATISTPTRIESEYIIKARVTGNDKSGNIYKQLYVEDETGALSIGIDQNSIWATHRVGQEVFINLHQLFMLKYGGEMQLGYDATNANRIAWEVYTAHVNFNGHPDAEKVKPVVVTINNLTNNMVNALVRIDGVTFVNGGKQPFTLNDNTTEQAVKDASGNTINVRTSSFSTFAKDLLPEGAGSIVGILGRYNGSWQFTLRDTDDLIDFSPNNNPDPGPGPEPGDDALFSETFGPTWRAGETTTLTKKWDEYVALDQFDMKAPIVYSTGTDAVDFRSTRTYDNPHVWFAANYNKSLKIEGIAISQTNLQLSYDLACNQDGGGAPVAGIMIKCNNVDITMPTTNLGAQNQFTTITVDIPNGTTTIEFYSTPTSNPSGNGYRLDNIKIESKQ